jgi:GNAT superfamily N-acetyltransferase
VRGIHGTVTSGPLDTECSIGQKGFRPPYDHEVEIRRAQPDDWPRVRDLRLRALLDAPDAFGSTHAQEAGESEDEWRAWVTGWPETDDQASFVALDDGEWIGIALGVRWQRDPELVNLYAMWVDPSARRRGVGRALAEAVIAWARDLDVHRVVLRVNEGNPDALALYKGCGFIDTGEREPLRAGSQARAMAMERLI